MKRLAIETLIRYHGSMLAERIGEFLLMVKAITVSQLAEALTTQRREGKHRFLGDILLEQNALSRDEFNGWLERYLMQLGRRLPEEGLLIGNLLVQMDAISRAQLDQALQEQQAAGDGAYLGQILVDKGYLGMEDLEVYLANQHIMRRAKNMDQAQ